MRLSFTGPSDADAVVGISFNQMFKELCAIRKQNAVMVRALLRIEAKIDAANAKGDELLAKGDEMMTEGGRLRESGKELGDELRASRGAAGD